MQVSLLPLKKTMQTKELHLVKAIIIIYFFFKKHLGKKKSPFALNLLFVVCFSSHSVFIIYLFLNKPGQNVSRTLHNHYYAFG